MAKKNPLFSRTQLALILGLSVLLLLCFVIRLLPDRPRAETNKKSGPEPTTEITQVDKEEPETNSRDQAVTSEPDSERSRPTPTTREKLSSHSTPATTIPLPSPIPTGSKAALVRKNQKFLIIVIDDVGQNLQELEPFLKLPVSLTFSILPHLSHSQEAARRVRAAGKEAILHMPMEPMPNPGHENNPGPGALFSAYSNQQIVEVLDQAFASVPGVKGFNNHMGSLVTANIEAMRVIFRYAAAKGLFFLDSRTTNATVAPEVAREFHVPLLERTNFLDNDPEAGAIKSELTKVLEEVVKEADRATPPAKPRIAIGHVQSHALPAVIRELLPLFTQAGIEFARLDEFCN